MYVLMKQVEELTDSAISGKSIQIGLSVWVQSLLSFYAHRGMLTGISIFLFLVPGYAIAFNSQPVCAENFYCHGI